MWVRAHSHTYALTRTPMHTHDQNFQEFFQVKNGLLFTIKEYL